MRISQKLSTVSRNILICWTVAVILVPPSIEVDDPARRVLFVPLWTFGGAGTFDVVPYFGYWLLELSVIGLLGGLLSSLHRFSDQVIG